jgi:protein involved in polysaccharide export with SLBB domain
MYFGIEGRRIEMTKSWIISMRKGEWGISSFALTVFLFLFNGYAALGSDQQKMEQADQTVSIASDQSMAGSDYALGPGDKLEVTVYRHEDLTKTIQIDHSGKIAYPLVGEIQAGGVSVSQLRNALQNALAKYIVNPEVFITVTAVKSQSVIVLGEVNNPGLFSLDVPRTCLQMIASAGGFTNNAKPETVLLIRGGLKEPEVITLNYKRIFQKQTLPPNVSLRNGDIVYVPATKIENVARYFDHLQKILGSFYQAIFAGLITTSTTQ